MGLYVGAFACQGSPPALERLESRVWLTHRGVPVRPLDDRLRRDWYGETDERVWLPIDAEGRLRVGSYKGRCSIGARGVTARQRKPLRIALRFADVERRREEVPVRLRGDCAWVGSVLPVDARPRADGVPLDRDWVATWRVGLRDRADLQVEVQGGPVSLRAGSETRTFGEGTHRIALAPSEEVLRIAATSEGPSELRLGLARARALTPPPVRVDHVLVVLIDTLRADRLRAYAPTTRVAAPNLDRLAAEADVFLDAHAVASWTKPAVASVLTGLYPWQHGAFSHDAVLREDATMLGERLQDWGVRTAAFVGNGYVSEAYGFARGWDHFGPAGRAGRQGRLADLSDEYFRWLDGTGDTRTFAYLHAVDPHSPYAPPADVLATIDPEPYAGPADFTGDPLLLRRIEHGELSLDTRDRERLVALYDAEVAHLDRAVGALLDGLAERGLAERTLLVFVADHGEELFDHGSVGHGGLRLHDELVRVPLLVRWPGVSAGRRVRGAVSQIDIAPTVLEALEVEVEGFGAAAARSLRERATATDERFVMLAEGRRRIAVTDGSRTLIRGRDGRFEGETDPELRRWLLDAMAREMDRHPVRRRVDKIRDVAFDPIRRRAPLDDDLAEQLRALGYLGDENTE